jgi:hypothetical protein
MEAKTNKALYIKLPDDLHQAAREYAVRRKIKGGLSAMIRDFLVKKTGFVEK